MPSPTYCKTKYQILVGVDRVISVDLQRPGQGHEACFFDNTVPLEAIVSTDHMVDYFVQHVNLQEPIVVVTPNNECVKKARNFQLRLQGELSLKTANA
jgi:ribose-phosphate pyrophosphokinase